MKGDIASEMGKTICENIVKDVDNLPMASYALKARILRDITLRLDSLAKVWEDRNDSEEV